MVFLAGKQNINGGWDSIYRFNSATLLCLFNAKTCTLIEFFIYRRWDSSDRFNSATLFCLFQTKACTCIGFFVYHFSVSEFMVRRWLLIIVIITRKCFVTKSGEPNELFDHQQYDSTSDKTYFICNCINIRVHVHVCAKITLL